MSICLRQMSLTGEAMSLEMDRVIAPLARGAVS
jgi:hypothetical protein